MAAYPRSPVPPGPSGELAVDDLRSDPLTFLTGLARDYGDLTVHTAEGEAVYCAHSPELAKRVLRDLYGSFVKTATPDDAMLRPLLGNGLLTSDGPVWERQRRQCAPAFRPHEVARYDELIVQRSTDLAERWSALPGPVRVDHDLMQLTLNVVSSAVLGSDLTGMGGGFGQAVDAANRLMSHHRPDAGDDSLDTRRRLVGFLGARKFLDFLVSSLIKTRRLVPHARPADLLDDLLATEATEDELRDQVLTIIMAGHETTAKTLTWALHLLDRHPDQRARLEREVDEVLDGRPANRDDVARLPFTHAVICEAMRLYPPVWLISRRCIQPAEVGGYLVPVGALMCVSPYVLHRRAEHWPQPAAFHPDRFIDAETTRHSHSFLPFGGGPRTCIGQHFALLEAILVLATLTSRVRLSGDPAAEIVPEALVTLRPRDGLTMTVHRRAHPPTAHPPTASCSTLTAPRRGVGRTTREVGREVEEPGVR